MDYLHSKQNADSPDYLDKKDRKNQANHGNQRPILTQTRKVQMDYLHSELTEAIIGAFYDVYNILGYGFLEKAYENAMVIELRNNGLHIKQQQPIHVYFRGEVIGEYFADLIVNDLVIVELKASRSIIPAHNAQLLNYLKATKYEVGLLLNFGHMPKFNRKAWSNDNKPYLQDMK